MKRYLVGILGEGDQYIGSYIIAEVDKIGERDINLMINAVSERGVCVSPKDSTTTWIYKIIQGDRRTEVLDETNMKKLYTSVIERYNEK